MLASSQDAFTRPFLAYLDDAAKSGGLQLDPVPVAGPPDFAAAFAKMAEARAGAVLIQGVFNSHRAAIVEIASKQRLPTMWFDRQAVVAGGLISLSANTNDIYERAAAMTDKVLKGAKPADLPVEQPALRAHHQPQVRQGTRPHPAAIDAGASRRSDRMKRGLFPKYVVLFVGLVAAVLVINGAFDMWFAYQENRARLDRVQHEKAEDAAQRRVHLPRSNARSAG